MNKRIINVAILSALFGPTSALAAEFVPRIDIGQTSYEQTVISINRTVDIDPNTGEETVFEDDVEPVSIAGDMVTASLGFSILFEKLYIDVDFKLPVSVAEDTSEYRFENYNEYGGDDWSYDYFAASYTDLEFDRNDWSVTLGTSLTNNLSVFAGVKGASSEFRTVGLLSEWSFDAYYNDTGETFYSDSGEDDYYNDWGIVETKSYDTLGYYAGVSYLLGLGDSMSLALSGAFAVMNSETEYNYEETEYPGEFDQSFSQELDSATGVSLSASLNFVSGIYLKAETQSYDFGSKSSEELDDFSSTSESSTEETVTRISLGYRF